MTPNQYNIVIMGTWEMAVLACKWKVPITTCSAHHRVLRSRRAFNMQGTLWRGGGVCMCMCLCTLCI